MQHSEVPLGLVKRIPFKMPSVRAIQDEDVDLHFHLNTDKLIRVQGLSEPQIAPPYGHWDFHAERAVDAIYTVLRANPVLIGQSFSIGDGTNWVDGKPTGSSGSDILYINVHWSGKKALVILCLGWSQTFKTGKLMRIWDPENQLKVAYEFDLHLLFPDIMKIVKLAIRAAAEKKGRGDLHAVASVAAYEETMEPRHEYPIAAATYLDDVVWYADRPYRHHHVIHSHEFLTFKDARGNTMRPEQGFLTNHGNFINRKRAMLLVMQSTKHCMLVAPEQVAVALAYLHPFSQVMDRRFFGLPHLLDDPVYGLAMGGTDLFSEDIW